MNAMELKPMTPEERKRTAADLYRILYLNNLSETLADCLDSVLVDLRAVCRKVGDVSRHDTRRKLNRMVELTRGISVLQTVVCKDIRDNKEDGLHLLADSVNSIIEMFMPDADLSDKAYEEMIVAVTKAWTHMRACRQHDADCISEIEEMTIQREKELKAKTK